MKHLSLQQRVAAFAGNDSGYDLMDDSLTDMRWLQRMDAGNYSVYSVDLYNSTVDLCITVILLVCVIRYEMITREIIA